MDAGPSNDNSIGFDISYAKSIPGLLKIGVIVCSLLGLICNSSIWGGYGFEGWYYFVACTCMITSLVLLIFYLVRVPWAVTVIAWYLTELIYCALFGIFFAIASLGSLIAMASNASNIAASIFAALFAFGATGCLGFDALLKLKAYKRGEMGPARTTSTATSPQV